MIPALACVAVCVLPASWMLSAFGYPCRSLISDEGLRWLFLHLYSLIATPLTACALVYASAAGALEICARIFRRNGNHTSVWVAATAALALCSLPLLAKKLGFDPAVMASPFITTIVDALSLLVYFSFAKTLLGI